MLLLLTFSKLTFLKKFFQEYHQNQNVKQFWSRSGPTFCRAWSGFKTVCKGYQQMTLVGKELKIFGLPLLNRTFRDGYVESIFSFAYSWCLWLLILWNQLILIFHIQILSVCWVCFYSLRSSQQFFNHSTRQQIKCLAQGHKEVPLLAVRLKQGTLRLQV